MIVLIQVEGTMMKLLIELHLKLKVMHCL